MPIKNDFNEIRRFINDNTVTLKTTNTGGATSSAEYHLLSEKIVVTIVNASAKLATTTIETPLDFSVLSVKGIRTDSNATDDSGKLSVYNNDEQIINSSLAMGTANGVVTREAYIINGSNDFSVD